MNPRRPLTLICLVPIAIAACAEAPAPAVYDGPSVSIAVAPLNLPGITDARYHLTVENVDDQVVWTAEIRSTDFGDGAGSVSYVGPCDAQRNDNEVKLELLDLYEGPGGAAVVPSGTYQNPGVLSRTVTCTANADAQVDFDVAILRQANQGFFDIAVSFDNVFCSAKLDCQDENGPIQFLHGPSGTRDDTIVLALACTQGTPSEDTTLYLDDIALTCAEGNASVFPTAGPGNLVEGVDFIDADADLLFGAATYRGAESLGLSKRFWNVALGFNGGSHCNLTTTATADDGSFTNLTTPSGTTWPVIAWNVPLTNATGQLDCTNHPVNAGTQVSTAYSTSPRTFAHAFGPSGVFSADIPIALSGGARQWANGTTATSCEEYIRPSTAPYSYAGDTGSGRYRIDLDGPLGAATPFVVECDMDSADGGWTLLVKSGPADTHPGWSDTAGYNTLDDPSHISRAWHELTDFTQVLTRDVPLTGGDISSCWSGETMAQQTAKPAFTCTPTTVTGLALESQMLINASTTYNGCPLSANVAYAFVTWDGGVSGAYGPFVATNGYKTNNSTNCGSQCVLYSASCLPDNYDGTTAGGKALWVR